MSNLPSRPESLASQDLDASTAPPPLSEDQQLIGAYLSSESYLQLSHRDAVGPARIWLIDKLMDVESDRNSLVSYWSGLLGLCFLLVFAGGAFPLVMEGIDDFIVRSGFAVQILAFQLLFVPPIICFSFVTVVPMFWFGSVTLRFLTAAVLVLPGCFAFYLALAMVDNVNDTDFWIGFVSVMFADFVTVGTVALTIQMWSPWSLSQARFSDEPLPPLGTRTMLELTMIVAVGCAVVFAFDTRAYLEGIMFFAGLGLLSSLAIIGVLIAFLSDRRRSPIAIGVAGFFAFATSFLICAFFAAMNFGYDVISADILIVTGMSCVGACIIMAAMALCIGWLRACGWRCVNRTASL